MPIYLYHCTSCGYEFEELVRSMNDTEPVPCPQCHTIGAERKQAPFAMAMGSSSSDTAPCGVPAPM